MAVSQPFAVKLISRSLGRRGTGKTHLLGSFNEFINEIAEDEISIFLSVLEVPPRTPPQSDYDSPGFASKRAAKELFQDFLRVFFKRFLSVCDNRIRHFEATLAAHVYKQLFQRALMTFCSNCSKRLSSVIPGIRRNFAM